MKKVTAGLRVRVLFVVMILVALIFLKSLTFIIFISFGNKAFPAHLSRSKALYSLTWPALYEAEVPHYNLGQAYYYQGDYAKAQVEYNRALDAMKPNDIRRCVILIQLANAQLKPLESEFDKGNIRKHITEVNMAVETLTKCLKINSADVDATKNIAILLAALEGKSSSGSDEGQDKKDETDGQKEAREGDEEAQQQQKEVNDQADQDYNQNDYPAQNW